MMIVREPKLFGDLYLDIRLSDYEENMTQQTIDRIEQIFSELDPLVYNFLKVKANLTQDEKDKKMLNEFLEIIYIPK